MNTQGARLPDQAVAAKGQFVLATAVVRPGASSRPPVNAEASCHADTAPTTPSRRRAAAATTPTASTASAKVVPVGQAVPCNGSSWASTDVSTDRTLSALRVNARSQPRTVVADRPNRTAIGRCPAPAAFCRNAAPITSAASARRNRHATLNSTWVTRQPAQRTRRGRRIPTPRTSRRRAYPHRTRSPPHGHTNSPADSRRSTSTDSVPTMITGASISTKERPSLPAKERGGPLRFHQRDQIVVAHQESAACSAARWTSSPATSLPRHAVLTQRVAQQLIGLTRLYASHTNCLEISNDLPAEPDLPTRLLPASLTAARLLVRTIHR